MRQIALLSCCIVVNHLHTAHSRTLPLAATYIIDRDGVVRYAFLDAG